VIHSHTYTARLPLLLLAALLVAACGYQGTQPSAPAAGSPLSDPATNAGGSGATVNVSASEFAFALDNAQAAAGPVTFLVKNDGRAVHDFQIAGAGGSYKTENISASQSETLVAELQPGTYTYRCTVGGHEMLGMKGTLIVAD
jgi:plastocyanin